MMSSEVSGGVSGGMPAESSGESSGESFSKSAGPQAPRVLFYVQHLLGIGHLMRAGRIAEALARHGFAVTLVSGGLPVQGFQPAGVQLLQLPPISLGNGSFGELVDAEGNALEDDYRQQRCQRLLQIFRDTRPHCVMLEAFPFGRRQVRFELLPLMEAIGSTQPKPVLVSSVRDILQRRSKPGRNEETADTVLQYFDKVLVHGDPRFARLDESFSCAEAIADRIVYTGLVSAPLPPASAERFDVVVSAGGGAVGDSLVESSIAAARLLPAELAWCVITGPNLPAERYAELDTELPANVLLERFRVDFTSLLRSAGVSVSQAGYNTMGDLLQAGCQAILVPYSEGGETEQADRADRLQRLGLAQVLAGDQLSGEALAALIRQALSCKAGTSRSSLDTRGAEQTAQVLQALIDQSNNVV